MNNKLLLCGFILLGSAVAGAQVASHAPTALTPAPNPGSAASVAPAADKPVAVVNGSVLTGADLLREEYTIFPYARQHNGGIPPEFAQQIRNGALKMIVFEELVYQEALRRHLSVPPAKMERAEADFRRQFGSPDIFNAYLQSQFHGSEPLLQEKIRRSLLIDSFLRTEVDSRSAVTPAEVRSFYDRNPARFTHPESYTFQTISVLPPDHATPDQLKEGRKRAEDALRQAKPTKTAEQFGLLAEKLSDDDYRVVMGQHKPVPVNQLAPPVLKVLRAMHVGEVSGLIQLDQAYTVIRLNAHTPAGEAKFQDVRPELEKELHEAKRNQLRGALDAKLRQNAKIEEF
ncbi:MAG TPA: peptidylprolyl isomerase [Acidobacteriaceae bacterium]|nr:peptidylprolyl isomerase [Acidobacteriaceae bacterium]